MKADVYSSLQTSLLEMANHGERVLAFADRELDPAEYPKGFPFNTEKINFPMNDLRLVGLMGMIDPPRETVPDAIAKCRTAGIKVMMVTGDHPATGTAIARKVWT